MIILLISDFLDNGLVQLEHVIVIFILIIWFDGLNQVFLVDLFILNQLV